MIEIRTKNLLAGNHRRVIAFTLVELLIVVIILSILSMVVIPKFGMATDDARESRLLTDVKSVRRVINIYKLEHNGRLPHLDENGALDQSNFRQRLLNKTNTAGKIDASGTCGPYIKAWPENPYMEGTSAQGITFGSATTSPRNGNTGWYYCTSTGMFWPNSSEGGDTLFGGEGGEEAAPAQVFELPLSE